MPDIPDAIVDAAMAAEVEYARTRRPDGRGHAMPPRDQVRRLLEAAAPLLAEARGAGGTAKPRRAFGTRDPRAQIPCRRCGAQPGRQCVTSSGTRAPMVHAERRNDWRRAGGQTAGLESEGTNVDRFPPPAPRG